MNDSPNRDVETFTDALALPRADARHIWSAHAATTANCAEESKRYSKVTIVGIFWNNPPRRLRCQPDRRFRWRKPGDRIGRYKLLQQIGEGGCGVVYHGRAGGAGPPPRRAQGHQARAWTPSSVIARFEAERQALALMDHPNIAKVFDAGATETGRPYFVMELVRGIKITEYCDQQSTHDRERLEAVHPGLPGHPARASKGNHPSGHQAFQYPGDR